MIDDATISKAAQTLLEAAPGSRVILFGSHARGDAGPDSDLDFLVIESELNSPHAEMIRLSEALRRVGVYADVLVTSAEAFEEWSQAPGTVIYHAAREGRVFSGS